MTSLTAIYLHNTNISDCVHVKYSHDGCGNLNGIITNGEGRAISCNLEQYTVLGYRLSKNEIGLTYHAVSVCLDTLPLCPWRTRLKLQSCDRFLFGIDVDTERVLDREEMQYLNYMWLIDNISWSRYYSIKEGSLSNIIARLAWNNSEYASIIPRELRTIITQLI